MAVDKLPTPRILRLSPAPPKGTDAEYFDEKRQVLSCLRPVSRINLLVGANNSGKSRMLRWLFHSWDGTFSPDWGERDTALAPIGEVVLRAFEDGKTSRSVKLDQLQHWLESNATYGGPVTAAVPNEDRFTQVTGFRAGSSVDGLKRAKASASKLDKLQNPRRLYVPVLRGARVLGSTGQHLDDPYLARTLRDDAKLAVQKPPEPGIFGWGESDKGYVVFTGQDIYRRLRSMLLGDLAERRRAKDWESFLSKVFFQDQETVLIPREQDEDVYVKVGRERERSIGSLGDGIQAILVLTALPFLAPEPCLFFVEEPETHLHPAFQRVFLDAWRTEPSLQRHVLFATTHSNHLLELTAEPGDVSVFAFEKDTRHAPARSDEFDPRFIVRAVSHGDWSPLRLLGVTHASVLLANCVILVEGVHDRTALRALLDSFATAHPTEWPFKEDLHYTLVEHAGSNIVHWDFTDEAAGSGDIPANRVLAHTFLVVDGDGAEEDSGDTTQAAERKRTRHEQLRKDLNGRFLVLPCRTIENLAPPGALAGLATLDHKGPFQHAWASYRHKKLGEWLDDHAPKTKGSWADESGAVANKARFWQVVGPRLASTPFAELQPEVQDLVRTIVAFVGEHNRGRG